MLLISCWNNLFLLGLIPEKRCKVVNHQINIWKSQCIINTIINVLYPLHQLKQATIFFSVIIGIFFHLFGNGYGFYSPYKLLIEMFTIMPSHLVIFTVSITIVYFLVWWYDYGYLTNNSNQMITKPTHGTITTASKSDKYTIEVILTFLKVLFQQFDSGHIFLRTVEILIGKEAHLQKASEFCLFSQETVNFLERINNLKQQRAEITRKDINNDITKMKARKYLRNWDFLT